MSPILYLSITLSGSTKVFPSVPVQSGKLINSHLVFNTLKVQLEIHNRPNFRVFILRFQATFLCLYLLLLQEYVIQELFSPIVTPFLLCFNLRYKSLDIVDFFRNFTVDVVGVGDVCSFAQMDVKRHGNPEVSQGPEIGERFLNRLERRESISVTVF